MMAESPEIFSQDLGEGAVCAYTGRIDSRQLRLGPGRRRVWSGDSIRSALQMPPGKRIVWLNQTHSVIGVDAGELLQADEPPVDNWHGNLFVRQECDFAWIDSTAAAIAISVADCIPIAIHDSGRGRVVICHAGWKGLAQGIIPVMIERAELDGKSCQALIGPHIHRDCFEIDHGARDGFVERFPELESCFKTSPPRRDDDGKRRYLADLTKIAQQQLRQAGISEIVIHGGCTSCAQDAQGWRYPSFRRNRTLERITMLAWLDGDG